MTSGRSARRHVRALGPMMAAALLSPVATLQAQADTAQPSSAPASAADSITSADLRRWLDALTADSMRSRSTPSPELERAAVYLGAQFKQLGLAPGDSANDSWLQRYPVPGQLRVKVAETKLLLYGTAQRRGRSIRYENGDEVIRPVVFVLERDARFVPGLEEPALPGSGYADFNGFVLVAGPYTAASLPLAELGREPVVYVPPDNLGAEARREVIAALAAGGRALIVAGQDDSASFSDSLHAAPRSMSLPRDGYLWKALPTRAFPWAIEVCSGRLVGLLSALDQDPGRLRNAAQPIVRRLPSTGGLLSVAIENPAVPRTAVNVLVRIEGSDSALKHEVVAIVAPIDRPIGRPGSAESMSDTTSTFANDNAAAAGLLALAKAFSQPGARPRRTLVFAATSGNRPGELHWGAHFLASAAMGALLGQRAVAVLALDGIGGAMGDSILVDGPSDIVVAQKPSWVAALHPELGLALGERETAFAPDHLQAAFARRNVPSLVFHGSDETARRSTSSNRNDRVRADPDRLSRVLRLVFYVGERLANADERPRWTAEGRKRYLAEVDP